MKRAFWIAMSIMLIVNVSYAATVLCAIEDVSCGECEASQCCTLASKECDLSTAPAKCKCCPPGTSCAVSGSICFGFPGVQVAIPGSITCARQL